MNHLNSVLLEGVVTGPAELETSNGAKIYRFTIKTSRFEPVDDDLTESASFIDVETYGKLATHCSVECTEGRGVRVVGRIKQEYCEDDDGKLFSFVKIVADHVEYKPAFRKAKESE